VQSTVYNGLFVALIAVVVGIAADRTGRHKEAKAAGYSLSGLCKFLLIVAGSTWTGIMVTVGLDRLGKGIRTTARDAMISLSASKRSLGFAFGAHRAMDSAGVLLGPVVAFLIFVGSNSFTGLWIVCLLIAFTGIAALLLFVPHAVETTKIADSSSLISLCCLTTLDNSNELVACAPSIDCLNRHVRKIAFDAIVVDCGRYKEICIWGEVIDDVAG
jgi:MFS-type transporter involved in bile tolerance (Atg22 family)